MVVVNDLEFQLVSAEDENRTPFKEHKKGLNTYVEVEPDAEYFISIRKVRPSPTCLYCRYCVDGKTLGYVQPFDATEAVGSPRFHGIYYRSGGISIHRAFRFVKASFTSADTGTSSTMTGMGQVKVDVYEGIYNGMEKPSDFGESFETSKIKSEDGVPVTTKKNIRSGEGHQKTENCSVPSEFPSYSRGTYLYTIILHYCAAPGLIAVGVLPKPPIWEQHRMLKPATLTAKEKKRLEKALISVKRNRNGSEILTLQDNNDSEIDSDDDDQDKNDHSTQRKQPKRECIAGI